MLLLGISAFIVTMPSIHDTYQFSPEKHCDTFRETAKLEMRLP